MITYLQKSTAMQKIPIVLAHHREAVQSGVASTEQTHRHRDAPAAGGTQRTIPLNHVRCHPYDIACLQHVSKVG
jgi:hypothetical protein